MPFVNLGVCPEGGSSLLLPKLVGHQRASELLLLGDRIDAERAAALGMVNSVCADADLFSHARAKALQLAAQPAASVRAAKSLLKRDYAETLRETIMVEGKEFLARLRSPEATEAIQAFLERRKPDFTKFR
jgi:enoyl-CoA hydratase/carnithine racemase